MSVQHRRAFLLLGFGGGVAFRSSITLFRCHRVWEICIFAVGRRA